VRWRVTKTWHELRLLAARHVIHALVPSLAKLSNHQHWVGDQSGTSKIGCKNKGLRGFKAIIGVRMACPP
jgi:hypothetical protein